MRKGVLISYLLILAITFCSLTAAHSQSNSGSTIARQVSIHAGQTKLLRVAAGNPSGATWYVNGVIGGNTVVGKVTSSGSYTAPATAPDTDITITIASTPESQPLLIAQIKVIDDPAILEAHQKWIDGAVEAAAVYGCKHPTVQEGLTETVAEALKVYLLTADTSSCLILAPVSADPELNRYSYAWGGNVDGVDIYYISDVNRPRIVMGNPVSGE